MQVRKMNVNERKSVCTGSRITAETWQQVDWLFGKKGSKLAQLLASQVRSSFIASKKRLLNDTSDLI